MNHSSEGSPAPETSRGNILVVDDTPDNLHLLSKMLKLKGYEVRAVTSGSMALTVVQVAPPELILLDIRMPQMDGYQVCRILKANPQTRTIPVIFLSAMAEVEDKTEAFEVGGVDFITKPFRLAEVVARVETHLTLCRLQQQLVLQNEQLQSERQQAETALASQQQENQRLLRALMPSAIAHRYQQSEAIADRLDCVALLSVDLANFETATEDLAPVAAAELLQQIRVLVHELVLHHHLDYVQTEGTRCLIAAGVPKPQSDPVLAIAGLAIALQQRLLQWSAPLGRSLDLQMGISYGTVHAAVVGDQHSHLSYALWGEPLRQADQLRSHSSTGRIGVSAPVYHHLQTTHPVAASPVPEVYWLLGQGVP